MSENNVAKKFDQGKAPIDLISTPALIELAKVLDFGAQRYGRFNWAKGLNYSRIIAAVFRHLWAWNNRQDKDQESGLSHLAHAMAGLMFLLDYEHRNLKSLDDRRPDELNKHE